VKIVVLGLSITSSWGNGHATTFRSLLGALAARGHRIVFFEKDQEWYADNRDLPNPGFCDLRIYQSWRVGRAHVAREMRDADVVLVGSYFPDGIEAINLVLSSAAPVTAFYDIDTPITVSKLRGGSAEYIRSDQIAGFDLYLSFTGGPLLQELRSEFGAQCALPLYCSVDPKNYRVLENHARYRCDFSYMGTYAPDRQSKLENLFCETAQRLPNRRFLVAGAQYPKTIHWPKNVRRITHLNPEWHAAFYSSSLVTLNLTREQMVLAGFSPSVRLFEAAACACTIVSDIWQGIETFFEPGKEILLAQSVEDVVKFLTDLSVKELKRVGEDARERVMAEHTSAVRAIQFEEYVCKACEKEKDADANLFVDNHVPLKLQDV